MTTLHAFDAEPWPALRPPLHCGHVRAGRLLCCRCHRSWSLEAWLSWSLDGWLTDERRAWRPGSGECPGSGDVRGPAPPPPDRAGWVGDRA